jgi:hypothetical protein
VVLARSGSAISAHRSLNSPCWQDSYASVLPEVLGHSYTLGFADDVPHAIVAVLDDDPARSER